MSGCEKESPGPADYPLPTLTGFEKHDISRKRAPAYSMGQRLDHSEQVHKSGFYDINNLTRYGKSTPPAYSLKERIPTRRSFSTPGAGTYSPEKCHYGRKGPEWVMGSLTNKLNGHPIPGPQYDPNPAIGIQLPTFTSQPAYTISPRTDIRKSFLGPGPAAYLPTLPGQKGAKILGRIPQKPSFPTPSPLHYHPDYNTSRNPPKFTFGLKHSPCRKPYITPSDQL